MNCCVTFLLLSVVYLSLSAIPRGSVEFYVTPANFNSSCPQEKTCHTLDYYARNSYLISHQTNVSLFFLKGLYRVDQHFVVSNTQQLSLIGHDHGKSGFFKLPVSALTIFGYNFILKNISFLKVQNLGLVGFGGELIIGVKTALLFRVAIEYRWATLTGETVTVNSSNIKYFTIDTCNSPLNEAPGKNFSLRLMNSNLSSSRIIFSSRFKYCHKFNLEVLDCVFTNSDNPIIDIYLKYGAVIYTLISNTHLKEELTLLYQGTIVE